MATKRTSRRAEVEVSSDEELQALYPKEWVAYEVLEGEPGMSYTRARLIAHGPDEARDRVHAEVAEWQKTHRGTQFGVFYTGPVDPDEDRIFAIS